MMDAGPWVSYKLTYEPLAQVSLKWGKSGVDIKMIKSIFFSIFLHKIICCGCVLEFYGELMIIKVKTLVFCGNFMSMEMFT